eukprot:scaffold315549_cov26-Prasinocladus_malaysianus.AAC.1
MVRCAHARKANDVCRTLPTALSNSRTAVSNYWSISSGPAATYTGEWRVETMPRSLIEYKAGLGHDRRHV